jgi:hypothetical protein
MYMPKSRIEQIIEEEQILADIVEPIIQKYGRKPSAAKSTTLLKCMQCSAPVIYYRLNQRRNYFIRRFGGNLFFCGDECREQYRKTHGK